MPSNRRVKVFMLAVFMVVFTILYYTSHARQAQNAEIYQKTVEAMDAKAAAARDSDGDVQQILDKARTAAAEGKIGGVKPLEMSLKGDDNTEEKGVAGRKKMKVQKEKEGKGEDEEEESQEDQEVKSTLNGILKRSPIIIFSKSYCRYSRKTKSILLDKYSIVPSPFVVELDQHPLGPQLQALLAKNTGRTTVPNVLINGRSIGGSDDVQKLDEEGELSAKVKSMGGKRIMEARLRSEKEPRLEEKEKDRAKGL